MQLKTVCDILHKTFPNPKTELNYQNEFQLLLAIMLSAQNTDIGVNKATEGLFKKCFEPQDIIYLGLEGLKQYTKTLNYYNTKSKNILITSELIRDRFDNKIPGNFEDLITLPGVGRKTANVFLNIAHSHDTIAVDTHVFRVTNRVFGKNFTNPIQTEEFLLKHNGHELKNLTHHLFILHGRYICKARKPQCEKCPLTKLCKWYAAHETHS